MPQNCFVTIAKPQSHKLLFLMCLRGSADLGWAWLTLAHVSISQMGALFYMSLFLLLGRESCLAMTFHDRSTREEVEMHKVSQGLLEPRLGILTVTFLFFSVGQVRSWPNSRIGNLAPPQLEGIAELDTDRSEELGSLMKNSYQLRTATGY